MDKGPTDRLERLTQASGRPEKIRLGELLVELRMITPAQLRDVLEQHLRSGKKVGRLLIEAGYLSEEQLAEGVAKLYRTPYVDLRTFEVDPQLIRRLPEAQARHHKALLLEDRPSGYVIGCLDPSDLYAQDEIARLLKRNIEVAVVSESQLNAAIDRHYRRVDQMSGLAKALEDELGDADTNRSPTLTDDTAVARLLNGIFEDAVRMGASDIHIEPQETKLQIRQRIDGVLSSAMEADLRIAPALVVRLKLLAGLNISERRLPQDGRFNIQVRGLPVDVRLSTLPIQYGESCVMRILSTGGGARKLDQIGMPEELLTRFREAIHSSSGLVLVTGPTGSGKTTTLYSALAELNTIDTKIITVEDPVEIRLAGINQVQVNDKIELTFGAVLRSVLRQDPDVILVGEMRDHETAQIGLRAAITGHLVFSTLHTRDAASTPVRLIDMGVPPVMVASAVQAVIAQRLTRVICESCAEPAQPTSQEIAWLESAIGPVEPSARFMRGRGCTHCSQTGFRGRQGIYELLEMTPPLVTLANQGDTDGFTKEARKQLHGRTMQAHGLRLAMAGRTTIAEIMRVASGVSD